MRCDRCGANMRYSKYGVCKGNAECRREYARRWREANPESARQWNRRWRETNPENVREYYRQWYEANQENVCARQRQAYKKNSHEELTYLVWSPGLRLHKIGFTTNTVNRMEMLRTGCPDVVMITTFPHGRDLEMWLHQYFREGRIRNTEWFSDITEVDVKNAVIEYERALRND